MLPPLRPSRHPTHPCNRKRSWSDLWRSSQSSPLRIALTVRLALLRRQETIKLMPVCRKLRRPIWHRRSRTITALTVSLKARYPHSLKYQRTACRWWPARSQAMGTKMLICRRVLQPMQIREFTIHRWTSILSCTMAQTTTILINSRPKLPTDVRRNSKTRMQSRSENICPSATAPNARSFLPPSPRLTLSHDRQDNAHQPRWATSRPSHRITTSEASAPQSAYLEEPSE